MPLRHCLEAVATVVPPDVDAQDRLRERYDDRSIAVAKTMGSVWIDVVDRATGGHAATAVFAADALVVRCDTVDVMQDYREKGVANAMYKIASRIFAAAVVPSDNLSPAAERFWRYRTRIEWRWWDAILLRMPFTGRLLR